MRGPRAGGHPVRRGVLALIRPRLLVLRALGLGDLLTGVPALRALRRGFPDHEVVLAAPRVLTALAEASGAVDRMVDTRGLRPVPWSGAAPDVAVNLHGRGPQSHRLLQDLRPGRLVGFDRPDAGHRGPGWRPDEHEVRRWCRLLRESLGLDADPADLLLPAPDAPAPVPGAVVVHPGAAYPSRRWPADRFAAVARWAAGRGLPVVLTGTADERALADAVRRAAGLRPGALLAGRTDLAALAAQVASAPLVVAGDTGVAHLASAYARPSVLLFGPTPPSAWGPPEAGPHRVLWHGAGRRGDPWGDTVDSALAEITVAEVVEAAGSLLGRGVRGSRPTAGRTTPSSA